jgi:hypothetical protein
MLKETLDLLLKASNIKEREIGYFVIRDEQDPRLKRDSPETNSKNYAGLTNTSFATSEKEVHQMADLLVWTVPGMDLSCHLESL